MDATTRRGDQPANDQHSHGLDDSHAAPTARRDLWSPKDHRLRPETSSDAPKETPMAVMPCAGMVTPPQVTYPHQHVLGQGAIVEPGNCPTECQKCEFLIQSVRVADPEQCDEDLDNARMEVVRIVRGGDSSLLIRPRGFRKNLTWFKPTIVGGTAGEANPWDLRGSPIATKTVQAATVAIHHWLEACAKDHKRCQSAVADDAPLPTRVLDLGPDGSDTLTLLETAGHRGKYMTGRYMCLSYCWGKGTFIRTTYKTLKTHEQGISPNDLPLTLRDAVAVTRALGVRYLWIDALCIIQDSTTDWEAESSRMADIYRHSWLTIAASGADSVECGLFPVMDTNEEGGGTPSVAIDHFPISRGEVGHLSKFLIPKEGTSDPINKFPLLRRAWAFQERMLAPRILHFGPQELLWECLSRHTCECGNTQYKQDPIKAFLHDTISDFRDTTISNEHVYRQLVMSYSVRDLTYPSDRLPAFSGVVKAMDYDSEQGYVAGLWIDTLLEDMCWFTDPEALGPAIPWRAPSWSWASVNGPALYDTPLSTFWRADSLSSHEHSTVKNVHIVLAGMLCTGQLEAGFLELETPLIPATEDVFGRSDEGIWDWRSDERNESEMGREMYLVPLITADHDCISRPIFLALVVRPEAPGAERMVRADTTGAVTTMLNVWPGRSPDPVGVTLEELVGKRVITIV